MSRSPTRRASSSRSRPRRPPRFTAIGSSSARPSPILSITPSSTARRTAPPQTGAGGESVGRAVGEGDRIFLAVADGGHGIPEADRSRAVERFVRLEQSRSKPGSGLGLSLASAVARLHGGELKLEDNHPGLKTVISLPRAASVAAVS